MIDPMVFHFFHDEMEKQAMLGILAKGVSLVGKGVWKGGLKAGEKSVTGIGKGLTAAGGGPVKGALLGGALLYGGAKGVQHYRKKKKEGNFAYGSGGMHNLPTFQPVQ